MEDSDIAIVWIMGLVVTCLCLIAQVLFILRPNTRNLDQQILSQFCLSRLINSITEIYVYRNVTGPIISWLQLVFVSLWFLSDVVSLSWMFVYVNNLHKEFVPIPVIDTKKWSFLKLCKVIWLLPVVATSTFYMLSPLFRFGVSFAVLYILTKCGLIGANIVFFCKIFYVFIKSKIGDDEVYTISKHYNSYVSLSTVNISIVSFILFCMTCVHSNLMLSLIQIFEVLNVGHVKTIYSFLCASSAYQGIAVTYIFLILAKRVDYDMFMSQS